MKLIILGPPGAGKGTQASKLKDFFGIPHISTGDLFRANISQKTELGKLAKSYIDKGELVPSQVTVDMVNSRLDQSDALQGFILDGFPRTVDQAVALRDLLRLRGWADTTSEDPKAGLDGILSFTISDDVVVSRMLARGRDDDTENVIRNRLAVYHNQTAPLLEYYGPAVSSIEAEGTEEEVFDRTLHALGVNR